MIEKSSAEKIAFEVETSEVCEGSSIPYDQPSGGWWYNLKDSFKRADVDITGEGLTDHEKQLQKIEKSPLKKNLKNRHLQMIAIGGSIGTGLFVGSGACLQAGGPAGTFIAYAVIGSLLFVTVQSLGELAVAYPLSGAFSVYNSRFVSRAWGFAMGWNYAIQWLVILPFELVVAGMVIQYWNDEISPAAWVSIFYSLIVFINFFGGKGYGEAEFFFSLVKVISIIGYIILGIILVSGGGPNHEFIGGKYWHNPGAFRHGFKGLCSVFVTAAFGFAGTEMCALAAAETVDARKSIPKASKQVFWRITLFFLLSVLMVGLLVPYNDSRLGTSSYSAKASPFVISISNAGIKVLPSIFNVIILFTVLSVGNSSTYGCSRTILSLAEQGFAPKIFTYIDKKGRPIPATIVTLVFGLLSFLAASDKQGEVFDWLLAITGLCAIMTWGSICACHIIFRKALTVQGRGTDELAFTSITGTIGSWYGLIGYFGVLAAQFWIAAWPFQLADNIGDRIATFLQAYLAVPVVFCFYIAYVIWNREFTFFNGFKNIDLDHGRKAVDLDVLRQEVAEERAYFASQPWWWRWYNIWC